MEIFLDLVKIASSLAVIAMCVYLVVVIRRDEREWKESRDRQAEMLRRITMPAAVSSERKFCPQCHAPAPEHMLSCGLAAEKYR